MSGINDSEDMVVESRCEKCGNEYPQYEVVKKGMVSTEGYYPSCDCVVEIRLKKWQIPVLLGAVGLGVIAEVQCSRLAEASEEGLDRYKESIPVINESFYWRKHVNKIVGQINNQTGISLEYLESAKKDGVLDAISKFVDKEVQRRISEYVGRPFSNRNSLHRKYFYEDEVMDV